MKHIHNGIRLLLPMGLLPPEDGFAICQGLHRARYNCYWLVFAFCAHSFEIESLQDAVPKDGGYAVVVLPNNRVIYFNHKGKRLPGPNRA